ncbi:DNA topoisomerase (ATP-hydrolyzing) subunit A [Alicyclobacillus sp. SO9]|uniref:DNA gyrase/topoisomerase IV subunit A n=1 Tax=Alicyclobacillus sp. SO9 TaxID=2665646 RepID=UPI0018E788F8|nr:DNA topoisomerase (ATP-hydrolyzing) subunit A [Alicyclobacillus sp. SO9]QQE78178.1 DNA topoisomerase 4 subunit A [Alicyclobacillus sp. SO9]
MSNTEKTILTDISELLGDRFGRYSKYTIQHRAIPDARDGLKPVQRRILYAMYLAGNTHDKGYRKSAKTVGDVMGNYHPHGDSSIYEAMVHLAQPFKTNQPLIDGHGNWGSIDKDPPAAMRYTEARLSPYALELLADIKKDTVRMVPNFDETTTEPIVLPARLPNLLINGASGIASGFATNIPPHNPKDVVEACTVYLKNKNVTNEELIEIIKAPDFPTGCEVMDTDGIRAIYTTGSGSFVMSARMEREQPKKGGPQLVFSHLPYNAVKQQIVVALQEIVLNRDIEGIVEVRDETDRKHGMTGARIVVELKRGLTEDQMDSIVAYLYKNTDLMSYYRANMTAIVNGSPEKMDLKKFVAAYIEHQREIIRNRTQFDLNKAKERFHIVEGYIKALDSLDEVIAIIRGSKDRKDAVEQLISRIELTEIQANAILDLRLYRLTNMEIDSFKKEWEDLQRIIRKLEGILSSATKLDKVIERELSEFVKNYTYERLSPIKEEVKQLNVDVSMTIPEEDVYVVLTRNGYIKRLSKRAYMGIERIEGINLKLGDSVQTTVSAKTTDTLLLFTSSGSYYSLLAYRVPEGKWKDEGSPLHTVLPVGNEDKIVAILPIEDFEAELSLCFLTAQGMAKKTSLKEYKTDRSVAVRALKLKDKDELRDVFAANEDERFITVTERGFVGLYDQPDVPLAGKNTLGVKVISLSRNDSVLQGYRVGKDTPFQVILFEQHGYYRIVPSQRLPGKKRGNKGTQAWKSLKSEDRIVTGLLAHGMLQRPLAGAYIVDGRQLEKFELDVTPTAALPVQYAPLDLHSVVTDIITMPQK